MAQTSPTLTAADTWAYRISVLASPFVIFPLLILSATWAIAETPAQFLLWTSIILLFTGLIPGLYILWGIQAGRLTDIHIMVREQRAAVFLVFLVSAAAGIATLWMMEAPTTILLLALIAFGNGLVAALITLFWKVSVHSWVYAGPAIAFVLLSGYPWGWWLLAGLPIVVWARTHRRRHTPTQGIVGALLGIGLTWGLVMLTLR